MSNKKHNSKPTTSPSQARVDSLTREEIVNEYADLCARAGDLQYKIHAYKHELDIINDRMQGLNYQAHVLAQQEAAKDAK
jgi:hypothetical protein